MWFFLTPVCMIWHIRLVAAWRSIINASRKCSISRWGLLRTDNHRYPHCVCVRIRLDWSTHSRTHHPESHKRQRNNAQHVSQSISCSYKCQRRKRQHVNSYCFLSRGRRQGTIGFSSWSIRHTAMILMWPYGGRKEQKRREKRTWYSYMIYKYICV